MLSFCGAGEKDKILSFNDYSHRQKKIVAGENYLYWVHDLFSNVIVFAGATLGGFLLTTHVPVGGALIAVLFLTVSELWEIPVALF